MALSRAKLLFVLAVAGCMSYAQPVITSIVDPYTGGTKLSPGGQALITGTSLGLSPLVSVGGVNAFNLVPPQFGTTMTIEIPQSAPLGATIPVIVTTGAGPSAAFNITLGAYAPVLISLTSGPLTSPRHVATNVGVTAATPAAPGEAINLYVIGLGPTTPSVNTGALGPGNPVATPNSPVTVTFGANAPVAGTATLSHSQGFFGATAAGGLSGSATALIAVFQVVTTVPVGTAPGSYPISVTIAGVTSNVVMVPVGPAPAGPVISAIVGESGKTQLCPGDVAILSGLNLGSTATVMVGGKAAYTLSAPGNANQMTIQIPVDAAVGMNNVTLTPAGGAASAPFAITLSSVAPALYLGSSGTPLFPFHMGGSPVNQQNPASPGERITILVYGLGATTPVVPTGTAAPSDPPAATVALPTVSLGGVSNIAANLAPGQIGVYAVSFNVSPNQTSGSLLTFITIGGVNTGLVPVQVFTGPVITSVQNAASQIAGGLPNSGIAQGAIMLLLGRNLGPADIAIDSKIFQDTTFSNTSVTVTVGGTPVQALMYYTATGYVAALLPSNTQTGTGTITVTYNGQTSPSFPITVVANNIGVFTYTQDGQGIGIVTFPDYTLVSSAPAADCGVPITSCGAANVGDTLIAWTTGLGPITGSDATGAGLGVDMQNIPVQAWIGGVAAQVGYRGRSGCCIGEDQIVFTVPDGVPLGCSVPLVFQVGNEVSNATVMAVASKGGRSCKLNNPALTSLDVEKAVMAGPVNIADITLKSDPNGSASLEGDLIKLAGYAPGSQPFFSTYVDDLAPGSCLAFGNLDASRDPPITALAGLDAGPSFTITGPNGVKVVPMALGGSNGSLGPLGTFVTAGGAFTVTGTGGADIGAFTTGITFPVTPTLTSPSLANKNLVVTRANGMTFTWSTAGVSGNILIQVQSAADASFQSGATVRCTVPASAGTFTVPPTSMLALPLGSFATYSFYPAASPVGFTAMGLSVGFIESRNEGINQSMTLQ